MSTLGNGEGITERFIGPTYERRADGVILSRPFVQEKVEELYRLGAQGRDCLVLGSGPNTKGWKSVGMKTLDIDLQSGADYIGDANRMGELIGENTQDVIFVEFITFDPTGEKGVNFEQLVKEALKALKPQGQLIIRTAAKNQGPEPFNGTLPDPKTAIRLMTQMGYLGICYFGGEQIGTLKKPRRLGDEILIEGFVVEREQIYLGMKPIKGGI